MLVYSNTGVTVSREGNRKAYSTSSKKVTPTKAGRRTILNHRGWVRTNLWGTASFVGLSVEIIPLPIHTRFFNQKDSRCPTEKYPPGTVILSVYPFPLIYRGFFIRHVGSNYVYSRTV